MTRNDAGSRSDCGEQPWASTTHSIPFMAASRTTPGACRIPGRTWLLRGIGLPQSMQNFVSAAAAARRLQRAAPTAGRRRDADSSPRPSWLGPSPRPRRARRRFPPPRRLRSPPRSEWIAPPGTACILPMSPIMFMPMRWSSIFCSSSGSERFSTTKVSSARPKSVNAGFSCSAIFSAKLDLVRRHVEERHLAGGKRVGHPGDDGVAQLAFEIGDAVDVARAADLGVERSCGSPRW